MKISFTPKPYNRLMQDLLLKKGEGTFEIVSVIEKNSKETHRPMLEIALKVTDSANRSGRIKYFIMLDDDKDEVLRKFYNLCYSCGRGNLYDAGVLDDRLVGARGKLIIGINKGKDGNEQNTVVTFLLPKIKDHQNSEAANSFPSMPGEEPPPFVDDDLPITM